MTNLDLSETNLKKHLMTFGGLAVVNLVFVPRVYTLPKGCFGHFCLVFCSVSVGGALEQIPKFFPRYQMLRGF